MNSYIQDDADNANDVDNATVVDENWSEYESNIIDGIVKPILASLNTSASQDEVDQVIMAVMMSICRLRCG